MNIDVITETGIEGIDLSKIDLTKFEELLSRMSVELPLSEDANTLLYSGRISGFSTLEVVKSVEGVRLIMNNIYIPHLKWGPRQSRSVA